MPGTIVIYQDNENNIHTEVQLEHETVWLSQGQLAELFKKTKQYISLHIRNIFNEGELEESSVVKESLTTAADGKEYLTKLFDPDVVDAGISVLRDKKFLCELKRHGISI